MGLFIDAEHRGVRWRIKVEADDVGSLLLKVRVVRRHVALDPMGLEAMLAPHARHHHVADVQMRRELARGPVRRGTRGVTRGLQDPRLKLRREHRRHLADMPAVEPGNALLGKALTPTGHEPSAAVDPLRGFIPRMAIRQQQNQPCSSGVFRPIGPAACPPRQFHTLRVRQGDGVCHGRHYSL